MEPIMSPERMEQARRFHTVRYRLLLLSTAVSALYLLALIFGGSRWLALVAPHPALFVFLLLLGSGLVGLPVDYYGFLERRRYGLAVQSTGSWLADEAKGFLVNLVVQGGLAWLVLWSWSRFPGSWYVWSALVAMAGSVFIFFVAPVLIMPLFHKYTPMADGELKDRLMKLSERAGVYFKGVFVSNVSQKDTRINAMVTGLGSTRRMILFDTMIAACTPEEVEVVMGHEMGHHAYNHVTRLTAMYTGLFGLVFLLAGFVLKPLSLALGLGGLMPAALPLLIVLYGGVFIPLLPLVMALSRRWERDCDRFALTMTRNPGAFISAFRKIADRNLADLNPPRWVYLFLNSHPVVPERIAAAERFQAGD